MMTLFNCLKSMKAHQKGLLKLCIDVRSRHFQPVLYLTILAITALSIACSGNAASSSSITAVQNTFEGEITSKSYILGEGTMRAAYKGNLSRTETETTFRVLETTYKSKDIDITDFSAMTTTTLDPQEKTYTVLNYGEAAKKLVNQSSSPVVSPNITSTGQTETIAGRTCRHWITSVMDMEFDICLAQGLNIPIGRGKNAIDLKSLMKTSNINPEFAKFIEGGVFPLKSSIKEGNGQWKTLLEVVSIEEKAVDDSLFIVPADYKKKESPVIPNLKP
jgi:Domain of unknown function (DUF4412)